MKNSLRFFSGACLLLLAATSAWAPSIFSGYVYCDDNQDGAIDGGDTALSGVGVMVNGITVAITDEDGFYSFIDTDATASGDPLTLDASILPSDTIFIIPSSNSATYFLGETQDWLIDSSICHPTQDDGQCWLTAGGVKFDTVADMLTAEHPNGKGPKDSVGGVAYPGCSPFPSNGGQWNHVAHSLKLHLIGQDITVIRCGNVPDIPPGAESPVCDVNFIEFEGTGVLKGIHGNKMPDTPVSFWVRAEDRNEPGNEQALNSDDGELIDRYFLRVVDGDGVVRILVDMDGVDGSTIDPLTITGGNFQIHCSSCD